MIRIPIHSVTDLITNSSTTIYTYSDQSAAACIAMVDEILKVLGVELTCADMFRVEVVPDNYWEMLDWADDNDCRPAECPENSTELRELVDGLNGAEKPEWLRKLEAAFLDHDDSDGNSPQNTLELTPLKPEYAKVGELITKFLYSTSHKAVYNG